MVIVTSELLNPYLPTLFFLLQLYLSYKANFKAGPLWHISYSSPIIPETELIHFCFILPEHSIYSNLFFSSLYHQRRYTFYSCISSPGYSIFYFIIVLWFLTTYLHTNFKKKIKNSMSMKYHTLCNVSPLNPYKTFHNVIPP